MLMATATQKKPAEKPSDYRSLVRIPLYMGLALLLCYAHVAGSRMLVLGCLLGFLLCALEASVRDADMEVLLFFLPWSPLLKQQVGQISFYTVALLLICAVALARRHFTVRTYQVVLPSLLLVVTLVAKLVQGPSFSLSYLVFFAMLFLFPCVAEEDAPLRVPYVVTVLSFASGIASAALSAQLVAGYHNIAQFINVDSWAHVTRLSGYYGDPNFYSAQISACLGGILLVLARERSVGLRAGFIGLLVLLLYCGLLSASKSFVVVGACELFVWVLLLLGQGARRPSSLVLLAAVAAVLLFALSTSAFQNLLAILDNRFSYANTLSDITTGRSDVWRNYLALFMSDSKLVIFGEGFTNILLPALGDKASHNTIIQCIYQFGLIGTPLVIAWFVCLVKSVLRPSEGKVNGLALALMLVAALAPWLALDYVFFDEFFLLPVFAIEGARYFSAGWEGARQTASPVPTQARALHSARLGVGGR